MTTSIMQAAAAEVVTFRLGSQWFGIDVLSVQEVIGSLRITHVPLADAGVVGLLNLRGQIVTAIDLHWRLEISRDASEALMNVVIREGGELFALVVDEVGDVVAIEAGALDPLPARLDGAWSHVCTAVVRMERGLLAVLDVTRLLDESNTRT